MRTKAMLVLAVCWSGCGGANASATTTLPEASAPALAVTPLVAGPHAVNCDERFPRANIPDEPTLSVSGPLRVRAQSLFFDWDADSPTVTFCVPRAPLPEGTRLVGFITEYESYATTWDGTSVADPFEREGEEEEEEEGEWDTVTLPGQSVSGVRRMQYCPTDPSRGCLVAGDYELVAALSNSDPNGPRSGWDFSEDLLSPTPATRGGRRLPEQACGLTVTLRGETDCEGATLAELGGCFGSHYEEQIYESEDGTASEGPLLVLGDRTQEVRLPAYSVARVACVEGVAVIYEPSLIGFGSRRSFAAIDVTGGRIVAARRMTIVDHEEGQSDCANAWDGVELVPIVGHNALIGAVVQGAGASPRFDVGHGDVGQAMLAPSAVNEDEEDEEEDEYGAPGPQAYRVTDAGLVPIEVAAPRAPTCPLRVADEDGQTNVRPDPSTRREPVGTIPTGTAIQTVEQRGRWYRIEQPVAGWLWSGSLSRRCTP